VAIAQAVIALHGHALVAIGWMAGFVTYIVLVVWSSDDLYLRVELALVGSSIAALAVFAMAIRAKMRRDVVADGESAIEAFAERLLD
jgi:hypothetical protein